MRRRAEGKIVNTLTCYEEIADGYDRWKPIKEVYQAEERVLLSLVSDVKQRKILDVGCGTGRYTKRFENLESSVVGIDISSKMIRQAKAKTKRASLVIADASHPPFKDELFDTVLSTLMLNHMKDLNPFLAEIVRTCHSEGELILSSVWREGFNEITEFHEYFGSNFELMVTEYLYPPNVLQEALLTLGVKVTHSIISLYTNYGQGQKGVHIISAIKSCE